MAIEGWKIFAALIVIVALYGITVAVAGVPATPQGFLIVVLFSGAGLIAGRLLRERME